MYWEGCIIGIGLAANRVVIGQHCFILDLFSSPLFPLQSWWDEITLYFLPETIKYTKSSIGQSICL